MVLTSPNSRLSVARDVVVPAVIRLTQVLVQLLLLNLLNRHSGRTLHARLLEWDGQYYAQIASGGYPGRIEIAPDGSLRSGFALAFHPLYPGLAGVLHTVTRIPVDTALLTVAIGAGGVAAVLCHLLVLQLGGTRRAGYCAAGLFGALPMAVVFQLGYAESLFAALTAGCLLAGHRGRWAAAAMLGFAAGLTRPVGLLLAIPLLAIAWEQNRLQRNPTDGRPPLPAPVIAAALASAGAPAYWLYVGLRTGDLGAWFQVQRAGWDTHFDGGKQAWQFVRDTVVRPDGLAAPAVCLILLGFLAVVLAVARRPTVPYWLLAAFVFATVITSTNYWHSKPRLLLAGFVIVVPVALRTERLTTRSLIIGGGFATLVSAWFGAYLVDIWRYAI